MVTKLKLPSWGNSGNLVNLFFRMMGWVKKLNNIGNNVEILNTCM